MEYKRTSENKLTKRSNLYDERERNRILMQYGGIFKNNIREYATKVITKTKKQKNFAK